MVEGKAQKSRRQKQQSVEITLDLGKLKSAVKQAARSAGLSVDEFIADALKWRIAQDRYDERDSFTPHGGKHLMGKSTGYEVTEDHRYYPAPAWRDQFNLLFAERAATYGLVDYVVAQSEKRLREVENRIQDVKQRLIQDLGLDPHKNWIYYGGVEHYIAESKETEPEKEIE